MRQWGKEDIKHARNLAKYVQRAKLEMTGGEALGVALDLQWLSDCLSECIKELQETTPKDAIYTSLPQIKNPITEPDKKGKKK